MSIQLYYLPLAGLDWPALRAPALAVLNASERERFERCIESVQIQFAMARLMAKTALAERLGYRPMDIEFELNSNGKPSVAGGPHFSISHCKSSVVVAVGECLLGVDAEQIERERNTKLQAPWEMVDAFLNPAMAEQVNACSNDQHRAVMFTQLWTSLESQVKLEGSSVFILRDHFELKCEGATYRALNAQTSGCQFTSWQFVENEIVTLATEHGFDAVDCFFWREDGRHQPVVMPPIAKSVY